jgi:hypothetical protein
MAISTRARRSLVAGMAVLLLVAIAGATRARSDGSIAAPRRPSASIPGTEEPPGSGSGAEPGHVVGGNPGNGVADCGVEQTGDGADPDTPVAYTPCPGSGTPTEPTSQHVVPRPGMADVFARPWDSASVADDDRTVTVDFVSGVEPCSVLDHVDVLYGAGTVTITLYEGHDPTAGEVACIQIGVFKSTTVTLDEPLAGRTIVDGASV